MAANTEIMVTCELKTGHIAGSCNCCILVAGNGRKVQRTKVIKQKTKNCTLKTGPALKQLDFLHDRMIRLTADTSREVPF